MSRLPKVGGDDGTWGEILNDYLLQAHNADGTLKNIPSDKITGLSAVLSTKASQSSVDAIAADVANAVNRANHTGTQAISTIDGLQAALDDKLAADGLGAAVAAEVADAGSDTRAALDGAYAPLGIGQVTSYLDSLLNSDPRGIAASWATGDSALPSPAIYYPSIVNTGSQVSDWDSINGPADPNFLWSPGTFSTANGGAGDLEMHGNNKAAGAAGYPWLMVFEFMTTASQVDLVFWDGAVASAAFIEVNGRPLTLDYLGSPSTSGTRTLTLAFQGTSTKRIRAWSSSRFRAVKVPTGQTISKPAPTIVRRYGVIGDSWVNGASGTGETGSSGVSTWAAQLLRALRAQQPLQAGIGGRGLMTTASYAGWAANVASWDLDAVLVCGSINDPQSATGVQAAMQALLNTLSDVPIRVVVGCMRQGWEAYNTALEAAAQAEGVPFVPGGIITGSGNVTNNPQINGNAGWFLLPDNAHLNSAGHRYVLEHVFRHVAPLFGW